MGACGARGTQVGRVEIGIALFGEAEARRLNRDYRGKDYATNVLSFPYEAIRSERSAMLGDLAICPRVVAREARAQGKRARDHFAHLTVHGTLHLLGYDHERARDAAAWKRSSAACWRVGHPRSIRVAGYFNDDRSMSGEHTTTSSR